VVQIRGGYATSILQYFSAIVSPQPLPVKHTLQTNDI